MTQPRRAAPRGREFGSHAEFYQSSAYAEFPQEHRCGGTLGVTMFEAHQEPIDMIDAATPDLVLCQNLRSGREVQLDFGDGVRRYQSPPDSVVCLIPPNSENRFAVPDPHHIRLLCLNHLKIDALLDQHRVSPNAADALVGRLTERRDLCNLLDWLWLNMGLENHANSLLIDGLTLQVLGRLLDSTSLLPFGDANADTRIVRVSDYIEAHIADQLSVTELAAIAAMSAGHFSRVFKAAVGEPVWAYVQRRRCERAKELLLHTREPLAEIAYRTGFANQAHMTTSLKERYGATPGAMRGDRTGRDDI